jgi:hypothetical protein
MRSRWDTDTKGRRALINKKQALLARLSRPLHDYLEIKAWDAGGSIIRIGRYKGFPIRAVPLDYLYWMLDEILALDISEKYTLGEVIIARQKEDEEDNTVGNTSDTTTLH